jgi:hypothetical protein
MSTQSSQSTLISKAIGIALAVAAVICLYIGVKHTFGIVGNLVLVVVSLYILGGIATFWFGRLWEDGLTKKEFGLLLAWPLEIRSILKTRSVTQGFGALHINSSDDDSDVLVKSERLSQLVGVGITVLGLLIAVPLFIGATMDIIGSIVLLLVFAQIIGMAGYFWLAGFHKRQPSFDMLTDTVAWEIDLAKKVWKKAKRQNAAATV